MSAKPKKGRGKSGKTVNITDFAQDYIPEDAYDWADDDWMGEEQQAEKRLAEKVAKQQHKEYSRTANNKLLEAEGFRTAESAEVSSPKAALETVKPPYVAHFGNLRNGTTEEDFLGLFNAEVIVTHRLISQEGKSFAFVEFTTKQALAIALLQDGTMFRGRKMYVDFATEKQIDRLLNRNTGSPTGPGSPMQQGDSERVSFSRDTAGQAQPGANLSSVDLSRDAFGGEQQPVMSMLTSNGSRSAFGSRADLTAAVDLTRDTLGSAVQQPMPPGMSGSPLGMEPGMDSSSPGSARSPIAFGNWRDSDPVSQPEFRASPFEDRAKSGEGAAATAAADPPVDGSTNLRSDPIVVPPPTAAATTTTTGAGGRGERRGGRGGPDREAFAANVAGAPAEPKASAPASGFSNWRDEPRAEQHSPTSPSGAAAPAPTGERRGGRGGGRGRGAAAADAEKAAVKPPADWGSLRR